MHFTTLDLAIVSADGWSNRSARCAGALNRDPIGIYTPCVC
jgi:hypothetical protein